MNWSALKNLECPKCGHALKNGDRPISKYCKNARCDFKIKHEKFEELVEKMYKRPVPVAVEDNMESLNNFGHDELAPGFGGDLEPDDSLFI